MKGRGWPLALQLALSFTLIVAVALGGGGTFLLRRVEHRALATRTAEVLTKARAASLLATETRFTRPGATLTSDLFTFQQQTGVRPLVIGLDGVVTADSWTPSPMVGKPLMLPEVAEALKGREATGTRRLAGEGLTLYAAVPLLKNQVTSGAVLVSANVADVEKSLADLRRQMLWVLVMAGLVAMLLGLALAQWLSSPLERLHRAASALTKGRLETRVVPGGSREVAALGTRFNAMAEELGRMDEQRRLFVAAASHEMRTPVASVRALAEALLSDTSGNVALYKEYLGDIVTECEHAGHLVDRMLELARLEGRTGSLDATMDACAAVRVAVSQVRPLAQAKELQLEVDAPEELLLFGESWLLEAAVRNLVENAVKYTPAGGHVAISVTEAGGEIRVAVSDTGPGIPPEHLPHLFERFYRVEKSRSRATGGVGLGLTIAHRAVAGLGGRIDVASEPGRGSTFTVILPQANQTDGKKGGSASGRRGRPPR